MFWHLVNTLMILILEALLLNSKLKLIFDRTQYAFIQELRNYLLADVIHHPELIG